MFRSNKFNLIISIVAAICIWAFVITAVNPQSETTFKGIPVTITGNDALAENDLIVSPSASFTVDVVVRGTRSKLNDLSIDDIKATADVTGFPKGISNVAVNVSVPSDYEVADSRPQKIEIEVEDLVSVTKPVRLVYSSGFDEDVEPGFITISPSEIEVSGTRDKVNDIEFVGALIDTADLRFENTDLTAELVPISKDGAEISSMTLSQMSADIGIRLCYTKTVKFIANTVGTPPEGSTVTNVSKPQYVTVRGSKNAIAKVTEVRADDINISALSQTTVITPQLRLPEGVELAASSQGFKITVEVEGIETKMFSYTSDQIMVRGLAPDTSAHVNTGIINVTVYGTGEQLSELSQEELIAYVDTLGAPVSSDSITLEVQFESEKSYIRVECEPAQVRVTVTAGGQDITTPGASQSAE
jgi:YbbR domain-containing protein